MSDKPVEQEVCPVCGVVIENGALVRFSFGKPGTRSRLWARVCQYSDRPDCINRDEEKVGDVQPSDYYN